MLTDYSVQSSYPGAYEPVTETEYRNTVKIAEKAIKWVEKKMKEETK